MTRTHAGNTSHYVQNPNAYGSSDKLSFTPYNIGLQLRCPHCNHLIASDFSEVGKCGWCGISITRKREWAEMFCEASNVKAYHGSWNKPVLEEANRLKESGVVGMDFSTRPLNDVDRAKVARHVALMRKAKEQEKWNQHWRMQSPVSRALKGVK